MRPIATDGVAWSVCLCVCVCVCRLVTFMSPAKTAEPLEMLIQGRLGWTQGTTYTMWVQIPQGEWIIFWGLAGPLDKIIVSHCYSVHRKTSITASARLLQPTALLPSGQCYTNFSLVKNTPTLRYGPRQNSLTTFVIIISERQLRYVRYMLSQFRLSVCRL